MKTATTEPTFSPSLARLLRDEAGTAGDHIMVDVIDAALEGDATARQTVMDALADAAAQDDA